MCVYLVSMYVVAHVGVSGNAANKWDESTYNHGSNDSNKLRKCICESIRKTKVFACIRKWLTLTVGANHRGVTA